MTSFEQLVEDKGNQADRLAFIDFKLRYTGIIKRSDIGEMFNIGNAAASKAISDYNELRPSNLQYDTKTKLNTIIRNTYEPLLNIDAETALGMLANGFNKNKLYSEAKTIITFDKIGKIPNQLNVECISKVSRAIDGGYAIQCKSYLSENSDNRKARTLLPLAIIYDGSNWMFRAYDRTCTHQTYFKTFNFSRIRNIIENFNEPDFKLKSEESLDKDLSWNTQIPLELELHPSLSEDEKKRVRTDFGLEENTDRITIPTRHAFMWILEKKWFIDKRPLEEITSINQQEETTEQPTNKCFFKFRLTNRDTAHYYDTLVKESKK
ncbi:WYL domain-containing protein [Aliivibrio fischeri]|uniref:WYL domain-containing protein n=1 Tax=Aliivibrio fischeri TaxID=668 RepID=UPI0012DA9F8B|nr:WYL domain-containing protein [Aliivibrio fischeri]MUL16868.1 WYL domain-containing protein [Aliivibrio fischeri]